MSRSTVGFTVWDHIERDVFERLRKINRNTGYWHTLGQAGVVGPRGGVFPFRKQNPVIGVVIGDEECDDSMGVIMRRCIREVGLEAWVDIPRLGGDSEESRAYQRILSDIEETLIGTATGTRHTRGGYAEDTEIVSRRPIRSDNPNEIGAHVMLRIIYRHQIGDLATKL